MGPAAKNSGRWKKTAASSELGVCRDFGRGWGNNESRLSTEPGGAEDRELVPNPSQQGVL